MASSPVNTSGSIAVPGFVKGMTAVHQDFGKLSMDDLLDPSIKLAKEGVYDDPLFCGGVNSHYIEYY